MPFMPHFLKKLFGSGTQTTVSDISDTSDIPGIPDDLRQAAIASMQNLLKNKFEGTYLAHLSPNLVRTNTGPGRKHFLEAENLEPQHVFACWVWREGHWQPCKVARFLARRGKQGADWQEFGLRFNGMQATIVWQQYSQVLQNRRGGTGGTVVLEKTPEGWIEDYEQGSGWII